MKILRPEQQDILDKYTIENEPIHSIDLMERAALACIDWILDHFETASSYYVICGPGNNGGDGLAISRLLSQAGKVVHVYIEEKSSNSADYESNLQRLQDIGLITYAISDFKTVDVNTGAVLVDAMFGYGLNRKMAGNFEEAAKRINASDNVTIAIDVPSGVYANMPIDGVAVEADFTLSFQAPKLAFFIPENQAYTSEWIILDIGLDQSKLESLETPWTVIERKQIKAALPIRGKFDHKGTYGHALLIAGSYGKVGAAILSAKAALRSGVGLLTVHTPRAACTIVQIAVPEAMVSSDRHDFNFSGIGSDVKNTAIGIGCGLGQHGSTTDGILDLFKTSTSPLVIDADGLNAMANQSELLEQLPKGSILTPHFKEFSRLFGESENHYERLAKLRNAAKKHKCIIVLKGAHTAIADTFGNIVFNTTGNPGMATAGSGDVLTGIITGLLAQGMKPLDAALSGVYLHGLAGDIAAELRGNEALLASDIIDHIGDAYNVIRENK